MAAPALTRLIAGTNARQKAAAHSAAQAASSGGDDNDGGGRGWWLLVFLLAPAVLLVGLVVLILVLLAGNQALCAAGQAGPSSRALVDIPGNYLRLYQQAGTKYRLGPDGWTYLAGVGSIESDHGRLEAPGVRTGENGAGAGGPMQFLASTWSAYGVDGDGDGRADRYDPADAIPAAARYLHASGAPADWDGALYAYNHAGWYVDQVTQRAASYRRSTLVSAPLPTGVGEGLLVEGDSLAVGTRAALDELRPGARTRAASGRTSRQGLADLRSLDRLPATLVVALGTNDTDVAAFARNVRAIKALPGVRVIYWVNVARPPLEGSTDTELNAVLEREAGPAFRAVDWHAAVTGNPGLLGPDRIHATAAGYQARARLIHHAIGTSAAGALAEECGGGPGSTRVGRRIGQLARAQLGRGPRIPGFRPPRVGYAWCAWFATNIWAKAGVPIPVNGWSGYPYTWAQSKGLLFKRVGSPPDGATPPVGSALMYGTDPERRSDHVNLVDRVLADGTFMVTGGNQDGGRVTRYGPCRLQHADPAHLTGPGCDGRPIYGIAMPAKPTGSV